MNIHITLFLRFFFKATFCRLLDAAPELGVTDTQERVTPDLDRKKRVISREAILKQGEALMSELAGSRFVFIATFFYFFPISKSCNSLQLYH